jgi:hypothetical protein
MATAYDVHKIYCICRTNPSKRLINLIYILTKFDITNFHVTITHK